MPRFACLVVPDVPLAAALRAEPELRGHKLAIVHESAIVSGRLRGLTTAQARTIESDLVIRPISLEGVHSAQEALVDVALSITPRVEDAELGRVVLDLTGTRSLFPSERGLFTALETRLVDVGLRDVRMGIGPTPTVAELAARHGEDATSVEERDVDAFLGPLPLDLLDPPDEIFDRLTRWGVRTLGELGRIPRDALGSRLGGPGVRLARRARGESLEPFRPTPTRLRFEEAIETGYAMDSLEALSFLLRGVADRLGRRLRMRGLAVRELLVELTLVSGASYARTVEMAAPTVEARVLQQLVRLALEKDPPTEAVEHLRLIATPGSLEPAQLDLFLPPLPAPAELAITMARLESLCGTGRVGAPGVEDTHRPDAARLDPFNTNPRGDSPRGATSVREEPEPPAPAMALRALRPSRAVHVRLDERGPANAVPVRVQGRSRSDPFARGESLRVLQHAGPWRLFGEWWGERCFARDYFDVELEGTGVYRLYHNLDDDTWYVDGEYD